MIPVEKFSDGTRVKRLIFCPYQASSENERVVRPFPSIYFSPILGQFFSHFSTRTPQIWREPICFWLAKQCPPN